MEKANVLQVIDDLYEESTKSVDVDCYIIALKEIINKEWEVK